MSSNWRQRLCVHLARALCVHLSNRKPNFGRSRVPRTPADELELSGALSHFACLPLSRPLITLLFFWWPRWPYSWSTCARDSSCLLILRPFLINFASKKKASELYIEFLLNGQVTETYKCRRTLSPSSKCPLLSYDVALVLSAQSAQLSNYYLPMAVFRLTATRASSISIIFASFYANNVSVCFLSHWRLSLCPLLVIA